MDYAEGTRANARRLPGNSLSPDLERFTSPARVADRFRRRPFLRDVSPRSLWCAKKMSAPPRDAEIMNDTRNFHARARVTAINARDITTL